MEIEMLDAPEVREEPTAIQQTSIALVQGALTEFDKVAAGLADLKAKYGNVVYAVGTAPGMAEAKAARLDIRAPRYAVDRVLKATKEPLNAIKKELDDRAGQITAALLEIETPIHEQIRAEEDRKAAEKAERERIAAAQKLVVDNAIAWIRNHAVQAVGKCSADIVELIFALETMEVTLETYGDRAGEAEQCRVMTLEVLTGLHIAVLTQETAAAEVEAARIQLEQERAAQARAANDAAALAAAQVIKEAAEAKALRDAEQAKLDEQRRAFQQEQDAMRAKQAADLATAQKAFAELEAQRAEFEAEKAAKLDAEQKAIEPSTGVAELIPKDMAAEIQPLVVVIPGLSETIQAAADGDIQYLSVQAAEPSDADIIFCAARAVAIEYGMTVDRAVTRLANVCGWTIEGVTA